jgi:hypothetical protein
MTKTGRWLESRAAGLALPVSGSGAFLTLGLVLGVLGLGVFAGRLGLYGRVPLSVLLGWVIVVGVVVWGVQWSRKQLGVIRPARLAHEIEVVGGLRQGSITGFAEQLPESGSHALAELADERAFRVLDRHGSAALNGVRRRSAKSLGLGGGVLLAGATMLTLVGPTSPGGSKFWHPVATVVGPRGPVELSVDRTEVRRGDTVVALITAPGRYRATLWSRVPGEPWSAQSVALDSAGSSRVLVGPLDSDRFLRAVSGDRESDTVHVRVRVPTLLTELQLRAAFPAYLGRADEPLAVGQEPVLLPVGTQIHTRGRATIPLRAAEWRAGDRAVTLATDGDFFAGTLVVRGSETWRLEATAADGGGLDDDAPELSVVAVADSAPVVAVPIPATDAAAPLSLRQAVVIDAQDDYSIARVEVTSWRVNRNGVAAEPISEDVPLLGGPADRVVLQWLLDLNGRGLLPGDTAHFRVRAYDNAPTPQIGESREVVLWLPTIAELREAMRDRSRAVAEGADSLLELQQQLARELEDLAAERQREAAGDPATDLGAERDLPFESAEQVQQLSDRQARALELADELRRELRELSEAAWSAGITDPEFQRQLRDIQELLDEALSEELRDRLQELRDAVERLDADAVREALSKLAESANQLRDQLERSRELFERAAIEGELTASAATAEELSARQEEWNDAVTGEAADSSLAAEETELAQRTDSLAAQLDELAERIAESGSDPEGMKQAAASAAQAAGDMQQAASEAQRGERNQAQQSGESASRSLQPLAADLERQREAMREGWRGEVLEAMDRALVETARLAQQQQEVMQRLNSGESGPDVRSAQAAARAGVDQVVNRLQDAAGKNALVSPQTGAALGFSRLQMSQALDQLQRGNPNTRQAAELAGEALDGLNAVAYALLRSRSEVAGAESGSGLMEAMEQLAQLAEQQGEMNNAASGMLSLMPLAGQEMLQELQALAQQQRALANELDRLEAGGEVGGAGELAEEAREIAEELAAARLDPETIERQEQLFRRLLDAGRTLSSDEDETEERTSRTADPLNVQLPPSGVQPPQGGPRFRYPTWQELRSLPPEERRLILDYFRRLNGGRP